LYKHDSNGNNGNNINITAAGDLRAEATLHYDETHQLRAVRNAPVHRRFSLPRNLLQQLLYVHFIGRFPRPLCSAPVPLSHSSSVTLMKLSRRHAAATTISVSQPSAVRHLLHCRQQQQQQQQMHRATNIKLEMREAFDFICHTFCARKTTLNDRN